MTKTEELAEWSRQFRKQDLARYRRDRAKVRRRRKLTLSRVLKLQRSLPHGPMGPQGPLGAVGIMGTPGFPQQEDWAEFMAIALKALTP